MTALPLAKVLLLQRTSGVDGYEYFPLSPGQDLILFAFQPVSQKKETAAPSNDLRIVPAVSQDNEAET